MIHSIRYIYHNFLLILLVLGISIMMACSADTVVNNNSPDSAGQAGSLARFSIVGNYLYTVDHNLLRVIDITDSTNPTLLGEYRAGFEVETIYGFDHYLFLGTQFGVNVFDITDPVQPKELASFEHMQACDPVVTDGTYAYSTLRGGTWCRSEINQLDVYNLDQLDQGELTLIATYPMAAPSGIGLDDETLFLCDLKEGLKVYDVTDPYNITGQIIAHFEDIAANDVIPIRSRKILLLIAENGFFQYDYSDINDIKLLHSILTDK